MPKIKTSYTRLLIILLLCSCSPTLATPETATVEAIPVGEGIYIPIHVKSGGETTNYWGKLHVENGNLYGQWLTPEGEPESEPTRLVSKMDVEEGVTYPLTLVPPFLGRKLTIGEIVRFGGDWFFVPSEDFPPSTPDFFIGQEDIKKRDGEFTVSIFLS